MITASLIPAVPAFGSTDISIKECITLRNRFNMEAKNQMWQKAQATITRMMPCDLHATVDEDFATAQLYLWKVFVEYNARDYEGVNNSILDFETGSGSSDEIGGIDHVVKIYNFGFQASNVLGRDQLALSRIVSARNHVNSSTEVKLAASVFRKNIYAAATVGRYDYAASILNNGIEYLSTRNASQQDLYKVRLQGGVTRLLHLISENDSRRISPKELDGAKLIFENLKIESSQISPSHAAYFDAMLAMVEALRGDPQEAIAAAEKAVQQTAGSSESWTEVSARLLASRIAVMAGSGGRAIAIIDDLPISPTNPFALSALAEAEELRVRAHMMNRQYVSALTSMWTLRGMEAPGATYRMNMASLATVGTESFLPWGIVSVVLFLITGLLMVKGPKYATRLIPQPDPNVHMMSFGFPLFRPSERQDDNESRAEEDATDEARADRFPVPNVYDEVPAALPEDRPEPTPWSLFASGNAERVAGLTDHWPLFFDLVRDDITEIIEADPVAARALNLLNVTIGDSEHVFENVRRTMPHEGHMPRSVRLVIRTDAGEPDAITEQGDARYTCQLTERTFEVTGNAPYPAVTFVESTGRVPKDLLRGAGIDNSGFVLHPEILASGPDAVVRAIAILGALRVLDGLDGLRDGMAIDSALWNADLADAEWPDLPDWAEV